MNFIFDPSLVLYAPLHQLDGASFMSRDAYGRLCAVTGASWRPNGRYFDGIDDRIDCGASATTDFTTGDFTFAFWIKPTVINATKHVYNRGREQVDGIMIYIVNLGKLRFQTNQVGAKQSIITAENTLLTTEYQLMTITRSGATGKIYRNDTETGYAQQDAIQDIVSASAREMKLTAYYDNSTGMVGSIGEVYIYNRALTPLEIQHNYLATKERYK